MIIQSNSLRIDQILKFNSFLIYGPNIGKVDDILRKIVGILKTDWNKELGDKFFNYYENVFAEGKLSSREKSLIALAVSHVVQCPYCIDAYTKDGLEKGIEKEEMMEAVHVGAAIKSGAVLVHGVQMMNRYNKLSM